MNLFFFFSSYCCCCLTQTLWLCAVSFFSFNFKKKRKSRTGDFASCAWFSRDSCVLLYQIFFTSLERFGFQSFGLHTIEVQNFRKLQHATDWSWGKYTFSSSFFDNSFISLNQTVQQNWEKLPEIIEWWKQMTHCSIRKKNYKLRSMCRVIAVSVSTVSN